MSAASSFEIQAAKVSLHVIVMEATKAKPVFYNQHLDQGRDKKGKNRVTKFGSLQRAHGTHSLRPVPD
jgi:hypothetical protein